MKKLGKPVDEGFEPSKEVAKQYSWVKSNASCNIADIKGFVAGGSSSRFWIYRKHIISQDYYDLALDE